MKKIRKCSFLFRLANYIKKMPEEVGKKPAARPHKKSSTGPSKDLPDPPPFPAFCKPCAVRLFSLIPWQDHMKSKKHRINQLKATKIQQQ